MVVAVLVAACAAMLAGPAAAQTVLRGICEPGLVESWRTDGPAIVSQCATRLNADVLRLNVRWSEAEHRPGVYDGNYLGRTAKAVAAARAAGMQVIITVYSTPRWASDRTLWSTAPPGRTPGHYRTYYPPRVSELGRLGAFMTHVAGDLQGKVLGYSCWVEPNMWAYLYPQRRKGEAAFAAQRYTRMLAAFAAGVRRGDAAAQVIAGETGPTGANDRLGTSPQRFARQLATAGAAQYFDVYAHHPYPVGGSPHIAPGAMPRDPKHTVSLANLSTLLAVFPDKPFYLTEYGYPTSANLLFGVSVGKATQAAYLQRAFALAEQYPQVKLLLWAPLYDWSPTGTYGSLFGVYTGLRTLRGARKPAYYAFAGGNTLALEAPDDVDAGAATTLRGTLRSATMGYLVGKALVVERHSGRGWRLVRRCHTGAHGAYSVRVRPVDGAHWRVRWRGVVSSPVVWVAVGD